MKALLVVLLLQISNLLFAQQTVGLFYNSEESYNGYTLFAPMSSTTTYLIDNCGELVHSWPSTYKPALSVGLLKDGTLLRTQRLNNPVFTVGGSGGGLEMLDWYGNIIWEYTISSDQECQHHDIKPLANGNILVIVWDSRTNAQAAQAGRISSGSTLWSEKIIEIQPDLDNGGGTIVWEWYAWDHLVQDADSTKDNYGVVSQSPQLININYYNGTSQDSDWLHINSIDYNEEYDQVLLSNHAFSELWIIDHSTTTSEAAGHTGGNYNRGGDLLYRWGNPLAYDQGIVTDQLLFSQHDAQWIDDSLTDGGLILVFNNKAGFPISSSEVNIINPPVDSNGSYTYSGTSYLPASFHWTYEEMPPTDFYSKNISGAQRLPNDNTLICEGTTGRFFEIDYSGNIVWQYINPVSLSGIIMQGDPAEQNKVFSITRYPVDYPGFYGQTLAPQGYIESGSDFTCEIYPTAIKHKVIDPEVRIYPNPAKNFLHIWSAEKIITIEIYNCLGSMVYQTVCNKKETNLNTSGMAEGLFLVKLSYAKNESTYKKIYINK